MIVAIYVDDLNLFSTSRIMLETIKVLQGVFEMRDLGQTSFCLGLQFEYLPHGILLHQSAYIQKLLKRFNMHMDKSVKSPIDLRSLDREKDIFRKRSADEPLLGSDKPYLSAIGGLMFLANQTRPDIAFSVNLLARHSAQPTIRHWNGIKRIFRYLLGTIDLGLFYPTDLTLHLCGYADAGYLSDSSDAKSQTGYIFLVGSTTFSWKSAKQTLTTTSSNHSEIIALYEASRECIWLRNLIDYILQITGMPILSSPTVIYKDNKPCVEQIATGFIKGDKTKHISPKFFFAHELQGKQIDIQWIPSQENLADLLTKALPPILHSELIKAIGLRKLSILLQESSK
jgi:hypothetical protein